MEQATLRTAPNSTYKIYDALFVLEEGVITPDDSFMIWDGTNHPFELSAYWMQGALKISLSILSHMGIW